MIVVENCLVLSLTAEYIRWRCITHDLLKYTILGYTPPSRNLKNLQTFIKLQNPWGEVLNNSLLWSFHMDFVDISYKNVLFLILEDSMWLPDLLLNDNCVFVREIFFSIDGDAPSWIPQSGKEFAVMFIA